MYSTLNDNENDILRNAIDIHVRYIPLILMPPIIITTLLYTLFFFFLFLFFFFFFWHLPSIFMLKNTLHTLSLPLPTLLSLVTLSQSSLQRYRQRGDSAFVGFGKNIHLNISHSSSSSFFFVFLQISSSSKVCTKPYKVPCLILSTNACLILSTNE